MIKAHQQRNHDDILNQVTAINNINAMLAQATSSIRNENESLHNLQGKTKAQKQRMSRFERLDGFLYE